jgi:hypothetical protein
MQSKLIAEYRMTLFYTLPYYHLDQQDQRETDMYKL